MPSLLKKTLFFCFLILFVSNFYPQISFAVVEGDDEMLRYLLELSKNIPEEKFPEQRIIRKNEILFCSGDNKAALANNKAAELIKAGKYKKAAGFLEKALKYAPLFYPFRYNLGKCYYHMFNFKLALFHLNKARLLAPEYFLVYIQIGYIFEHKLKYSLALEHYRKAIKLFPDYLNSYILAGNIYFKRKQLEMAAQYYDASLKKNPFFANGILGRAKIKFTRKKYYKAYMLLKTIDTKQKYDKALHFYFAECAYKLNDFKEAYNQYTKLLEFKDDRFFMTTSINLIKHKQFLSKRFAGEVDEAK